MRFPIFGINDNMLVVVWGLGVLWGGYGEALATVWCRVRRKTALTHERISKRAGLGALRVGMVPNRSRDRNIPGLDLWPAPA